VSGDVLPRDCQESVAVGHPSAMPQPTSIRAFDLLPESFSGRTATIPASIGPSSLHAYSLTAVGA
jgi:hypothetical protein